MTGHGDAQSLARACAEAMWRDDRASQTVGMAIEHVAPGEARLAMTVVETMVNGHGVCHGGYIFMLADSAFAFACNTHNVRTLAAQGAITFLHPARLGERLIAEARQRTIAGRTGIYDVDVRRADGTVIAEFRGHSRQTRERFFPDSSPAKERHCEEPSDEANQRDHTGLLRPAMPGSQ